jgi:hypothetical protein
MGNVVGQRKGSGLVHDGPIDLHTRLRRHISNSLSWIAADDGAKLQVKHLREKYPAAEHRGFVGPCQTYNCHGLTFASRRTVIHSSPEIESILTDDGYVRVNWTEVKAGDIAIYRTSAALGAEIHHSGIVVSRPKVPEGTIKSSPKILSKWGFSHEVIHDETYCEYVENATIEYYRIVK